jgi:NAD(P)H-dependent FMN reductase
LPPFNPDYDREPLPAPVVALRRAIDEADALLICTPEYAGDMPGSFKNLLDWTVGGVETERKPAAWINASTGPTGAAGTHQMLHTVLSYTGCVVLESACAHVPVPRAAVERGVVADPELRLAIADVVESIRRHIRDDSEDPSNQAADFASDQRPDDG